MCQFAVAFPKAFPTLARQKRHQVSFLWSSIHTKSADFPSFPYQLSEPSLQVRLTARSPRHLFQNPCAFLLGYVRERDNRFRLRFSKCSHHLRGQRCPFVLSLGCMTTVGYIDRKIELRCV